MRFLLNLLLSAVMIVGMTACAPQISQSNTPSPLADSPAPSAVPAGSSIRGVFEGITPCSAQTRPLPQIPAETNCEQMIWKFTLYQDSATGAPTTYTLNSAYGVPKQGTPGLEAGGTPIEMEGTWTIVQGTKLDPDAVVYQLYSDGDQPAVSFLMMSNDLLHVLNRDQTLMAGNAAWSYTLNRTDNRVSTQVSEQSDPSERATRPPIPSMPAGSVVLGVFEGRLPCHEIVLEFTKVAPFPGCAKIKSRLTLYQDQATGAPSTYMYMGTTSIREGNWTILQGTESNPDLVVYRLQLDNGQEPVSFLKADDNHLFLLDGSLNLLVGNALFSYTLSRTDQIPR